MNAFAKILRVVIDGVDIAADTMAALPIGDKRIRVIGVYLGMATEALKQVSWLNENIETITDDELDALEAQATLDMNGVQIAINQAKARRAAGAGRTK